MKNILYIASYSGLSGANQSLVTLIKHLQQKDIKPYVILPKSGPIEDLLIENKIPYKIIRLFNWITYPERKHSIKEKTIWKIKHFFNFLQNRQIRKIIKDEKIDLIHINTITANWGAELALKNKIPLVWHVRELLEEGINRVFRNEQKACNLINKSTKIITVSDSVKEYYKDRFISSKMVTIYNGIESSNYIQVKNCIFSREKVILSLVGRIVRGKGHIDAIKALYLLRQKGINNWILQLVGDGDESYIQDLKKEIFSLNLENYIVFLGFRKDVHNIWKKTDIALICSKAEAFGRVTVEAMMGGAFVIGANTAGTKELLKDGYGFLYEQGNYQSLAEEIEKALLDTRKIADIAKKSQINALTKYTSKNNANRIIEVYKNILD